MPEAQALHEMSVRAHTSAVVRLFGARIAATAVRPVASPTPIARYESAVLLLLDELGAGLLLA